MLTVSRQRRSAHSGLPLLLQADGNATWPPAAATVRAIFSSRALQLLDLAHVVRESLGVALGRVQRQDNSKRRLIPTLRRTTAMA
jgi:hypothetical protein